MDIAKESKPSFKINKKPITLLINLPGFWLIYHLFTFGLDNNNAKFGSEFVNPKYQGSQLFDEFQKYRNNIYLFYAILLIGFGLLVMLRKSARNVDYRSRNSDQKEWLTYIIPAVIQGIILVTFSYSIAGLLLDLFP